MSILPPLTHLAVVGETVSMAINEIRKLMKNATDDDVSDLIDLVSEKAIEVGMSKPGFLRLMAEAFDFASRKENQ